MADQNKATKNDTVGLFLRAMVDREPGKRKVKPSKSALIDLAELDLGESSDDSDFNVDEAKLNDDDDVSINSDPDADDQNLNDDEDDDDEDEDEDEDEEYNGEVVSEARDANLSVGELLERAKQKQEQEVAKGIERHKILVCSVCLGDYSDDLNEIVTCDGCSVSVHEGCYGISDTISVSSTVSSCSTEPWFCDACKAGVENPPCELCPNLGYTILKETEMGRWVHLVCALYVPGVAFSEVDKLSFPTLFEMPYSKWGSKTCTLCEDERYAKTGVCIGCDAGMCRGYFHVTCAQREGLLSEVNHGEADQADPYYAHCKLHTDRELIRRRKRNWLALQLHMKQGEAIKAGNSQEVLDRIQRKLGRYREKYLVNKNSRPTPWYPTQKMPRAMTTNAALCRALLHKTELMGLSTETQPDQTASVGDIRKKWHIPPAFSVEFISYYLDRMNRMKEMKGRLDELLKENSLLTTEEAELRTKYDTLEKECDGLKKENDTLMHKALELHDLLKGLAGRPLPLPPAIAALHAPPVPPIPSTSSVASARGTVLITKAATKMISEYPALPSTSTVGNSMPPSSGGLVLNKCSVCSITVDQHLLIECDTCGQHYHLSCLDPPLTRMPKKTKQMGWQCSDCCKSSDSDKASEVDTAAPRRLRRNIKEPAKFSPSLTSDPKVMTEKPPAGKDIVTSHKPEGVAERDQLPIEPQNMNAGPTQGPQQAHLYHPVFSPVQEQQQLKNDNTNKRKRSKSTEEQSPGSTKGRKTQAPASIGDQSPSKGRKSQDITVEQPLSTSSPGRGGKKAQTDSAAPVPISPGRTRHTKADISLPETQSITSSPGRGKKQAELAEGGQNRITRRAQIEPGAIVEIHTPANVADITQAPPVPPQPDVGESKKRKSSYLDTSVDSLPSITSLHSPQSETFLCPEEDILSPKKERKHRDGSKKKKKDKDKDPEGGKKRKKHHHRDKHFEEMSSEMVSPFRIKIKPLPPRPSEVDTSSWTVSQSSNTLPPTVTVSQSTPSLTESTSPPFQSVAPAGYPPLPPGYTVTQPMLPTPAPALAPPTSTTQTNSSTSPSPVSTSANITTSITTVAISSTSTTCASSRTSSTTTSSTTTITTPTASPSQTPFIPPGSQQRSPGSANRKKFEFGDPQQFSKCDVCGETGGVTNTVSCDECHKAYHFNCLEPPLKKSPKRRGYSWFCEDCEW